VAGVKRRKRLSRAQQQRRSFLRAAVLGTALVALQPLGFLPVVRRLRERLRPPGASGEEHLLAACIKCGQCVQVCPVEAIHLADLDEGFGVGVPYIDARAQACDFSCDALSCILACPTGALSHDLAAKEEVRMGVARLAHPETCLARQGQGFTGRARGAGFTGRLRYTEIDRWTPIAVRDHPYDLDLCDLCVRQCPIGDAAIGLEPLTDSEGETRMTPVVRAGCVGCGACEMICPQQPACIVVEPWASRGVA
jgi:ferredoxin-type protein NapG